MACILGIDNGLDGALAVLHGPGGEATVYPTPTMPSGRRNGRCFNEPAMVDLLRELPSPIAYIEAASAMPKQGVVSMFSFGTGYGIWRGILAALEIPYIVVHARTWQKMLLAGVPKGDTKAASVLVAKRLFPEISLMRTLRCKKEDHGLSDALLIAEYGRRTSNV